MFPFLPKFECVREDVSLAALIIAIANYPIKYLFYVTVGLDGEPWWWEP